MMKFLSFFARPALFLRWHHQLQGWIIATTILLLGCGIYYALWQSPPDYQQGELVRIMYVHVPSAWMALFIYSVIAIASAVFLVTRIPLAHILALAASPIGAAFAFITLVTGSLWGKPTWGAYWVWDARLTSALILFFFYLAHNALAHAFAQKELGARRAAWLAIAGFINIPIVKFSVVWWQTLHQPASITPFDKPAIHPEMLLPLLLMASAFFCYFIMVTGWRMHHLLQNKKK